MSGDAENPRLQRERHQLPYLHRAIARAAARTVEIELEALSQRATRMRVTTRDGGFFYDGATASEIVAQTQKVLEAPTLTDLSRDAKRVSAN